MTNYQAVNAFFFVAIHKQTGSESLVSRSLWLFKAAKSPSNSGKDYNIQLQNAWDITIDPAISTPCDYCSSPHDIIFDYLVLSDPSIMSDTGSRPLVVYHESRYSTSNQDE